jgi:stringent starvation protein B
LQIGNEFVEFQARFGGVARDLSVPIQQVAAIYARENGAGMAFDLDEEALLAARVESEDADPEPEPPRPEAGRPKLQRIK